MQSDIGQAEMLPAVKLTLWLNPEPAEVSALLESATRGVPVQYADGRVRCFECFFRGRQNCVHLGVGDFRKQSG